jgi:hypothetical protein
MFLEGTMDSIIIMYVELGKRVFKAFESVLKEVSGRGLDLFIIFHLMIFSDGVFRCSMAVSKLLLCF